MCTIHRVRATSLGRRGTLARMTDYLSFYAGAVIKAMILPRFDAVVTLTTPPIIGLVGTLLKRLKGSPHVYWSMDLHPDASLALGRMSPRNPVIRGLRRLSAFVYRQADRVVVLGPYMADRIALKGVADGSDRDDPRLEPSRRDLPGPRAVQRAAEVAGPGRCVRGDVLGQPGPGPFVRRVPRGRSPAPRSIGHRLPLRRRRAATGRGEGRAGARGSGERPVPRLRAAGVTCTSRCRWPTPT